jgi:hypothetical protein
MGVPVMDPAQAAAGATPPPAVDEMHVDVVGSPPAAVPPAASLPPDMQMPMTHQLPPSDGVASFATHMRLNQHYVCTTLMRATEHCCLQLCCKVVLRT